MLKGTTAYDPAVDRGITLPQEQTLSSSESQELKKSLFDVTQLYNRAIKEAEQLRQFVERAGTLSEKEAQVINATLVEKDKTIGQLQFQLETLMSKQKEKENQLARELAALKEQLKTLQSRNSQLEQQNTILNNVFAKTVEVTSKPFFQKHATNAVQATIASFNHSSLDEVTREEYKAHHQKALQSECPYVDGLLKCVAETPGKLRAINNKTQGK